MCPIINHYVTMSILTSMHGCYWRKLNNTCFSIQYTYKMSNVSDNIMKESYTLSVNLPYNISPITQQKQRHHSSLAYFMHGIKNITCQIIPQKKSVKFWLVYQVSYVYIAMKLEGLISHNPLWGHMEDVVYWQKIADIRTTAVNHAIHWLCREKW